ncbi:cell wall-binding repeat-containing protein [Metaclostridioides mangenotii]|uniref:cell wall-binding repeat-containing protein n=1 Tax=Metaclostridioides mangenotii TaxID=1540 RepID=UPI0026EA72CE|nr:cell wall-binding repeat-containing protein [Clostridioides mangenotii]
MLKRKKILSKLLATTMVLTSFTVNASAAEVTSATIGGNDRYETAIKISENGWSKSNRAILINGEKGLVDALTATPYAYSKNAPILITAAGKLSPATANRLKAMDVKNVDIVGGVNSVSNQVVNDLKAMGITVNRISGASRYDTSLAVAKELDKIQDVSEIAVVNGDKGIPDAVSVAAPAASKKMPILLAENSGLNSASKDFVNGESVSKSYVIGSNNSVSDTVMNLLPGTKTRLGGADRHDTNAAVIKEFYTAASWNNVYVAKSGFVKTNDEIVDALAAGVLAAKNGNPIVLVGNSINTSQQSLLASKKFTKMTQIGMGIPTNSVNQIKATQADAVATITKVTVNSSKKLTLTGTNLNLIEKGNLSINGNTISNFTRNSATEAVIEFDNEFNNGSNTLKLTNNVGTVTEHQFTYQSSLGNVNSVATGTRIVGKETLKDLEVKINGSEVKSVYEINKAGWKVEFISSKDIFLDKKDTEDGWVSKTGRLVEPLKAGKYDYQVVLKKGDTTLKSSVDLFEVAEEADSFESIKDTFKLKTTELITEGNSETQINLDNKKMVVGEKATIEGLEAVDSINNTVSAELSDFKVTSSNTNIISVSGDTFEAIGSTGTSTITIKNKNKVLDTFNIEVVTGKRKATSVKFENNNATLSSSGTVTVMSSKSTDVIATVTDQHGSPYNGIAVLDDLSKTGAGEVTLTGNSLTAKDGKATLNIKGDTVGKVTYKITDSITNKRNLNLDVVKEADPTSWSLNRISAENNTIDYYVPKNNVDDKISNTLELNLVGKNSSAISGIEKKLVVADKKPSKVDDIDDGQFVLVSDNTKKATVTVDETSGTITVTAADKETGSVKISAYYKSGNTIREVNTSVTVNNNTPKMTSLSTYYVDEIKTADKYDVLHNLFNIRGGVVAGVKMSGVSEKVYLGSKDGQPIFFIPQGKLTTYTDGDVIIATIVINAYDPTEAGIITVPPNTEESFKVSVFRGEADGNAAQQIETININTK